MRVYNTKRAGVAATSILPTEKTKGKKKHPDSTIVAAKDLPLVVPSLHNNKKVEFHFQQETQRK